MKYKVVCVWDSYGDGWQYRAVLIHGRSEYWSETRYSTSAAAERAAKRALRTLTGGK